MKKFIKIILILLILFIWSAVFYWYHEEPADILVSIDNGTDIINAKNNKEIEEWIDNLNLSTDYDDKRRAIEFIDFCYALNDIANIQSEEFIAFANLVEITTYLKNNNINEPKDCINWEYLDINGLKDECIFNGDNWLQNPYISLYASNKITSDRFNKSMEAIAWYYKQMYPVNSFSLLALADKNKWFFTDKSYCDTVVIDNYDDFIRTQDWHQHIYTKTEEDLKAEQEEEWKNNINDTE